MRQRSQEQGQSKRGKQPQKRPRKHWARKDSSEEAAVSAREGGSLRTGLWIGRLVDTKSLNRLRIQSPIERLHGDRALTERLHSQSLDRLSADAEPTDAEPRLYVQRKTP